MKYILLFVGLLALVVGCMLYGSYAKTVTEVPGRYTVAELTVLASDVAVNNDLILDTTTVESGDVITTTASGRAIVRSGKQLITAIGAHTEMRYENPVASEKITITNGRVWSRLERALEQDEQYEIFTPTLAAAVRGTSFGTEVSSSTDRVLVAEGIVAVAPRAGGDSVLVTAGQQISMVDGVLEVRAITEDDRDAWFEEHIADDWRWGGSSAVAVTTIHRNGFFWNSPGMLTVEGFGFNQIRRIIIDGEAIAFEPVSDHVLRVPASVLSNVSETSLIELELSGGTVDARTVFIGSVDEVRANLSL